MTFIYLYNFFKWLVFKNEHLMFSLEPIGFTLRRAAAQMNRNEPCKLPLYTSTQVQVYNSTSFSAYETSKLWWPSNHLYLGYRVPGPE